MVGMPTIDEILTFSDEEPPPGASPWVVAPRASEIAIVEPDPAWPERFEAVAARVRDALGARALALDHVGSTSVAGLPAKPIIDIDLIVARPADEASWLPQLERAGFVLTVREPWWHEHRVLKLADPDANLHVFGPEAPEPWRHRIFRDHLRRSPDDRARYADVKREAARASTAAGELMEQYNARKSAAIREIYARAFRAAGIAS